MTWKLDYTAAQAGLKHLHRPDSSRLLLPRFGWREKTIISFATTILLATSALAQMPALYTLTLSLFNDARVAPSIVNSAEETASRIFAHPGIELHRLPSCRGEQGGERQRACIHTYFRERLPPHSANGNP